MKKIINAKYYNLWFKIYERIISRKFIVKSKLKILKNYDGIYKYQFFYINDANEYIKKMGYIHRKINKIGIDLEVTNEYISSIKNIQKFFNKISYSNYIILLINPHNRKIILEMPKNYGKGQREGTFCHIADGHSYLFKNIEMINCFINLIKTASKNDNLKITEPNKYVTRYVFCRNFLVKNHNEKLINREFLIILDFENITKNLVFFNAYCKH